MKVILFFFFIFHNILFSQLNFNSSLTMNYGNGSAYNNEFIGNDSEDKYNFSQILYDMNLNRGPWSLNSMIEFSNPPEIGVFFQGIRRMTFNYKTNYTDFSIGDIYRSWGKGLVLNQYDDISIGYDNGVRGVSISYDKDNNFFEFLSGNKKLRSFSGFENFSREPDKSTSNNLIGAHFRKKYDNFEIGFSTLIDNEKFALSSFNSDSALASHNVNSFSGNYNSNNFDISLEYANKYTLINPSIMEINLDIQTFTRDTTFRETHFGNGLAISSNYGLGIFSISIDYAYYAFFVSNPLVQGLQPYPERISQFQKPMVTSQEHSSILLNRVTYQQNSNDEIGLNLLLNFNIGENTNLIINNSYASSTTGWYREKDLNETIPGPWKEEKSDYLFPSTNPSSKPYKQNTVVYESFLDKGYIQFTISKSSKVNYIYENDISNIDENVRYEKEESFTIPVSIDYALIKNYNILFNFGFQITKKGVQSNSKLNGNNFISYFVDGDGEIVKNQNTYALNFGLSKSSTWSFLLNVEYDNYYEVGAIKNNAFVNPLESILQPIFGNYNKTWISTEINYRFDNNLQLSIFYGSNKGGISCANGICRYYPGFSDGLRMQITKSFY